MDFRDKNGTLDFTTIKETWMQVDSVPEIGVLSKDGDDCIFLSYYDRSDSSPLYFFSFVDEDVIQDIRNGRVDLKTGFRHHSAVIFKELENEGKIETVEVSYFKIPDAELPEDEAYLN